MESIPARNMNPPEMPEAPRCPSCDVPMVKNYVPLLGYRDNWECNNIMCEDCSFDDAEVVEKLRDYVGRLERENSSAWHECNMANSYSRRVRDTAKNFFDAAGHLDYCPESYQGEYDAMKSLLEPQP